MDVSEMPGWYIDAVEQGMIDLVAMQREKELSVQELTEIMADPATNTRGDLSAEQHVGALALAVALLIRRLARVDMP